jgi:radical SAM-linked protein
MLYRPLRERPVSSICRQVAEALDHTGYEELSLVSLSTSDYSDLDALLDELDIIVREKNVSLSFPSLRPDTFTAAMAARAAEGRTSGITFVPEAGTQRLRDVINKAGDENDLYRACEIALDHGFRNIKLYFMIGLPTETDDDLAGIGDMVRGIFRLQGSHRLQNLTLSISPFVPKAHTPFQRLPQVTGEELRRKMNLLRRILPRRKVKIDWRAPEVAEIEGILARGDRRLSKVIHRVWQQGARFCGWSDHFRYDLYHHALEQEGLNPQKFLTGIPEGRALPWGHLSKGISSDFLEREAKKALNGEATQDCRDKCSRCGLPVQDCFSARPTGILPVDNPLQDRRDISVFKHVLPKITIRVKYAVRGMLRFLSHLEMVRVWERVLRRSGLPVQFTEGYRARPRLSFSPPRPVGIASEAEYLDVRLNQTPIELIHQKLSTVLPDEMVILTVAEVKDDLESLDRAIVRWDYLVKFDKSIPDLPARCQSVMNQEHILIKRIHKPKTKHRQAHMEGHAPSCPNQADEMVDIRPSLISLTPDDRTLEVELAKAGSIATIPEILNVLGLSDIPSEIIRTHQWIMQNNQYVDPIEISHTGKVGVFD